MLRSFFSKKTIFFQLWHHLRSWRTNVFCGKTKSRRCAFWWSIGKFLSFIIPYLADGGLEYFHPSGNLFCRWASSARSTFKTTLAAFLRRLFALQHCMPASNLTGKVILTHLNDNFRHFDCLERFLPFAFPFLQKLAEITFIVFSFFQYNVMYFMQRSVSAPKETKNNCKSAPIHRSPLFFLLLPLFPFSQFSSVWIKCWSWVWWPDVLHRRIPLYWLYSPVGGASFGENLHLISNSNPHRPNLEVQFSNGDTSGGGQRWQNTFYLLKLWETPQW